MTGVVIYTRPGTDLHNEFCDAWLLRRGWTTVEESFYEILTMTPGWGPKGVYTRWQLRQAPGGSA